NHAGNPGGKSIWWNWVAPANGNVTLTTAGSAFNTLLAVYTGDSVSNLSYIASDNNSGGVTNRSIVQFTATAGTVYRIAVDGYNGASSRINLALQLDGTVATPPEVHGIARLSDGTAQFGLQGAPNQTYSFEATTDFKTWVPVGSIQTDSTGAGSFTDGSAKDFKKRFYRLAQ
ncbi:MAG: PPC domain-containing protein, partial [Verrucomicrobiota bacterium]